jgi:hypothetical protein
MLMYLRIKVEVQQMSPKVTAGWSSGLKSRLRNQSSQVQIPVLTRGFCDEQVLTSHGC